MHLSLLSMFLFLLLQLENQCRYVFLIVDQKWRDLVETGKASWVLHLKLTHCRPCLLLLLAKSKHMVISKVKNLGSIVYPLWNKEYSNRERRKFIQETQLTSFLFHFLSLDPRKCLTDRIYSLNFCWLSGWVNIWLNGWILHFLRVFFKYRLNSGVFYM